MTLWARLQPQKKTNKVEAPKTTTVHTKPGVLKIKNVCTYL
jgi:hypothetical protein